MPFSTWDIGECGCEEGPCVVTILSECTGGPLAGALVELYDAPGGTLLDSGTTGPGGTVALDPGGAVGYFEASRARFLPSAFAEDPCGGTYTLSADDDHACFDDCALPLPLELAGTVAGIPGVSDVTLTVAGAEWTAVVIDSLGGQWQVTMGIAGAGGFIYLAGPAPPEDDCTFTDVDFTCPPGFHYSGSGPCGSLEVTEPGGRAASPPPPPPPPPIDPDYAAKLPPLGGCCGGAG